MPAPPIEEADPIGLARAELRALGCELPEQRFEDLDPKREFDALLTCLMDAYRQTRSIEIFETLERLARPILLSRARVRLRALQVDADPRDVLQDALVNVFRYPGRFDASRPGAFRAWISVILDNAIRRGFRHRRSALDLQIVPFEQLSEEPDGEGRDPALCAERGEECRSVQAGMRLLLVAYLQAFARLSEREREVLAEVEVEGRRYAELSERLGSRPEALKMVVFRARRRIQGHLESWLGTGRLIAIEVDHAA